MQYIFFRVPEISTEHLSLLSSFVCFVLEPGSSQGEFSRLWVLWCAGRRWRRVLSSVDLLPEEATQRCCVCVSVFSASTALVAG